MLFSKLKKMLKFCHLVANWDTVCIHLQNSEFSLESLHHILTGVRVSTSLHFLTLLYGISYFFAYFRNAFILWKAKFITHVPEWRLSVSVLQSLLRNNCKHLKLIVHMCFPCHHSWHEINSSYMFTLSLFVAWQSSHATQLPTRGLRYRSSDT